MHAGSQTGVTDLERLPEAQRAVRAKCYHPSGTFVPFPEAALKGPLTQRFEQMVRSDPNRTAVSARIHAYTYGELDALANRIANAILIRSTAANQPVALLFRHGAPVIAAMIGALKAGHPYVALDTSYPLSRLAYVLTDSTSRLILTDHEHVEQARGLAGPAAAVLDIESLEATPDIPRTPAGPLDPAVLVYTSGSTGQPKGVVQSHRNVLYDVMHYANSGHFCADDRFLLVSSTSFADSLRTIYSALLNGAGLYPYDIRLEGLEPLADWITSNALTIYRSVPTVFRQFAGTLTGSHDLRSVRLLYLAGEPVKRADVDLYKRHFPPECILVDRLGTTEALTYRHNFIDHDSEVTGNLVPVGYWFGDKEVLLLDEQGNVVPTGAEGEIVVRSRYLSEGYWRRTDLTRAAFDVDPGDPEVRTYRTGDLGRLQADGALECLGRKDQQVKIRGHRIETAEVEAALLAVDGIREAVVTAEHRASDDRLIAYYVPETGAALNAGTLRQALTARLPDYMIPSVFMPLDALPLMPNGKLNRRALSAPGKVRADLVTPFVEPGNPIESGIADIWAEILEIDRVGIHDKFLDLGGNSISAMRVLARIRDRFHVKLRMQDIWKAETVAEVSELLETRAHWPPRRLTRYSSAGE